MFPHSVKPLTIPIPFNKLLKVVAVVDQNDPQTKQLLDHIGAENFEIAVTDAFDRQGVFQERVDGRIKFHTYVVRE